MIRLAFDDLATAEDEDESPELDQAPESDALADLRLRVEVLESDLAPEATPEPVAVTAPEIVSPGQLADMLRQELATARLAVVTEARENLAKATGRTR